MSAASEYFLETSLVLTWALLFALLTAAGEIGYRFGRQRERRSAISDAERTTVATLVGAVGTLLAFSLGMTISVAQSRFEARRDLVVQEANAIGTAWLRAGIFEAPRGPDLQRLVADYAKARLGWLTVPDQRYLPSILAQTTASQNRIWAEVTTLARERKDPIAASMMSAVNEMIDLSLSEHFAFVNRVPTLLLWSVVTGSMLAVAAMQYHFGVSGRRQPGLNILLTFMWTGAIVLIIDLNQPRFGGLRVDPTPLVWTIQGFGDSAATR